MTKHPSLSHLIFRKFSATLSSVFLMIFGSSFFMTFISLFLNDKGYSKNVIGIVQASFFLGMFIGAFKMDALIKRIGHIQSLAVFGSLASCATILQSMFQDIYVWMFLRLFFGLAIAALYVVIESWMLAHSSEKTRGVILSVYMIVLLLSQVISQQILTIIDLNTLTPFLLSALFTSLSVIPVALCRDKVVVPETEDRMRFPQLFKRSPFGVTSCFISGMIISSIYSFFPLLGMSREIPSQNLMSITIAGGVLLQWPIGKLSDIFERRKTFVIILIVTVALCLLSYMYTGKSTLLFLGLVFLVGGFSFTIYPLSMAQVCDQIDYSQIIPATALLVIAYGLGCVIGPIASSFVIEHINIHAIFAFFALLLLFSTVQGVLMALKKPVIPVEEQTEFIPMAGSTPMATEMDPRQEPEEEKK